MNNSSSNPALAVALRPEEAVDEAFVLAVYASTREDELRVTGWSREMRDAFLAIQFKAMRHGYNALFPNAQNSIILLDGQPVGRMVVARSPSEIRLVDIAVLPDYQSRGIGTRLIRQLLGEAETSAKTVALQVREQNPAARLYQRLGFHTVGQSGIHVAMEWRLTSGPEDAANPR